MRQVRFEVVSVGPRPIRVDDDRSGSGSGWCRLVRGRSGSMSIDLGPVRGGVGRSAFRYESASGVVELGSQFGTDRVGSTVEDPSVLEPPVRIRPLGGTAGVGGHRGPTSIVDQLQPQTHTDHEPTPCRDGPCRDESNPCGTVGSKNGLHPTGISLWWGPSTDGFTAEELVMGRWEPPLGPDPSASGGTVSDGRRT